MNSKTNEILNDVIHTASQAILCENESIKLQAIGDIVDALACVIPTERSARGADPTDERADGRGRSPNAPLKTKIRSINGCMTVIAKTDLCGRKFYAEAEKRAEYYVARVYEDRGADGIYDICRIDFADHCGSNAVMQMLRGVLIGISSHYGHKARLRANKRNRLALTVERELAATVARQMDDDDLAQRIENA